MSRPINWQGLSALRSRFLEQDFPEHGYWSPELLEDYDQTFAVRIGWKWDAVLNELKQRGWQPPSTRIVDWGCGTGIASRKFLEHFPGFKTDSLTLWDAVPRSMEYARRRLGEAYPALNVRCASQSPYKRPGILLLSHVINELDEQALEQLSAVAARAEVVIWVEPGSRAESRKLSAVRDSLLSGLRVVAPCAHASACPMLTEAHERHWCHSFTRPPSEVHQSPHWSAFARELNIDLGTVPYTFLVMQAAAINMPTKYSRVIGHPRAFKRYLRVLCCHEAGLDEWSLSPSSDKSVYKEAKKDALFPLIRCDVDNQRIRSVERWQISC